MWPIGIVEIFVDCTPGSLQIFVARKHILKILVVPSKGIVGIKKVIDVVLSAGSSHSQQSILAALSKNKKNLEYIRIQFNLPKNYDLADSRKKVIQKLMEFSYARAQEQDFVNLKNKRNLFMF